MDGQTGTTQYFEAAYPGLRELDVLSRIGTSAVVGSACPKIMDVGHPDAGYAPVFRALADRLVETLE